MVKSYLVPTVLEQTPQGERAFDIYSRLLKERIVFLGEDVNPHTANLVIAQLLYLAYDDPKSDIKFYINSPGGMVYDLAGKFRAKFPEFQAEILSGPEGNIHLDLQRTNTLQLLQAGLKPEHIENAHVCTCCHSEQFFSYRADKGKTGRIAAIISVK